MHEAVKEFLDLVKLLIICGTAIEIVYLMVK